MTWISSLSIVQFNWRLQGQCCYYCMDTHPWHRPSVYDSFYNLSRISLPGPTCAKNKIWQLVRSVSITINLYVSFPIEFILCSRSRRSTMSLVTVFLRSASQRQRRKELWIWRLKDNKGIMKKCSRRRYWSHLFNSFSMHCIEGDQGKKDPWEKGTGGSETIQLWKKLWVCCCLLIHPSSRIFENDDDKTYTYDIEGSYDVSAARNFEDDFM